MRQDNHTQQTECVICRVINVTSCEMLVIAVQVQSAVTKFRSLSPPVAAITQNIGCFRWNQPIIVNHFMSHTQSSTATYNPPSTSPAVRGQDCHYSSSQVTASDEETTHSSTDKKMRELGHLMAELGRDLRYRAPQFDSQLTGPSATCYALFIHIFHLTVITSIKKSL